MSAAAPWSVKGIEPRAREIAKDLARRSGMTLGEWLNTMILDDDEDGVVPLSNRRHASDTVDRRSRNRRMDDVYGSEPTDYNRLSDAIESIARRLEASERRSTIAIQGVDQAVAGLLRRLDEQAENTGDTERRLQDFSEELKEGQRRLRRFEMEIGPQTAEAFSKMETSITALSSRLYETDERQRAGVSELHKRMGEIEKAPPPAPVAPAHSGPSAEFLAQAAARLDAAQTRTGDALRGLERSFADLDTRLRQIETRREPEVPTDSHRFEKLAETLTRSVETNRLEMLRRLETAESETRMGRLEQALLAIGEKVKASEDRAARDMEAMGREVVRIAQNLDTRIETIERDGRSQFERMIDQVSQKNARDLADIEKKAEQNVVRLGQALEQRHHASEDRHALALEKLGGEITRISERLSDRISQAEHKNAQALDDFTDKLTEATERFEQRHDRTSGELAERMRQSEERTARLLADAREAIKSGTPAPQLQPIVAPEPVEPPTPKRAAAAVEVVEPSFAAPPTPSWAEDFIQEPVGAFPAASAAAASSPAPAPSAAFGGAFGGLDDAFGASGLDEVLDPNPAFGAGSASAYGSQVPFGGADISDVLAATDPAPSPRQHNDMDGPFEAESDFVDPAALRAAAAAGRASSTRQTIDAARAAMASADTGDAPQAKRGFGLKRGGKSRLQERMDDQAKNEGGTVRKALGASAVAMVLTAAAAVGYTQLTGESIGLPNLGQSSSEADDPVAAVALTPSPEAIAEGAQLYTQAVEELDNGKEGGLETMIRSAEMGNVDAQTHLANLYKNGDHGVAVDLVKSRAWAFRAAQSGDARSEHFYGMMLYEGEGGTKDRPEALTWLKRSADQGLIDSQYNIARLYENGDEGIPVDLTQAYIWYLIAARAGDDEARAGAERVAPQLTDGQRTTARTQVEAFQTEPLA